MHNDKEVVLQKLGCEILRPLNQCQLGIIPLTAMELH